MHWLTRIKWRDRLVGDDSQFHAHRCLMATELTEKGARSANQQDRLVDILKDEPKKYSLSKAGMALAPIPAIESQLSLTPSPGGGMVQLLVA